MCYFDKWLMPEIKTRPTTYSSPKQFDNRVS